MNIFSVYTVGCAKQLLRQLPWQLFSDMLNVLRGVVMKAKGASGGLQLDKRSTALSLTGEAPVNPLKFKGGSD